MAEAPNPDDFVRCLAPAVQQAATVARALEGRVANDPKWGEPSAVKAACTIADTACQESLLLALVESFPQVSLAAEEDTRTVRRFPQRSDARVVIDPIDGTLHFYLKREGPYAIMIGLTVQQRFDAGLVALPREGLCFEAARGAGARVRKLAGPVSAARPRADGAQVFVSADLPEPARRVLAAHGLEPVRAAGGAIAVAPLVAGVRAGLRWVGGQRPLGISIRGRIGALVASEAGCLCRNEAGAPFPLDLDTPARGLLVAADASDLAVLEEAVEAITSARSPDPRPPPEAST